MSTLIRNDVTPITVGETVRINAFDVTDDAGDLILFPNTITLQIVRPDQSVAATINTGTISSDGQGNFHYSYFIPANEQYGIWSALWTFVNGSYTGNFGTPFAVNQFNAYGVMVGTG